MSSLVISLPAIFNIMALIMLCIFIYAIFGMFLFATLKLDGFIDGIMNFRSLPNAMLTLLALSTAAGWNDFLEPMLVQKP